MTNLYEFLTPLLGFHEFSGYADEGDPYLLEWGRARDAGEVSSSDRHVCDPGRLIGLKIDGERWIFEEDLDDGYRSLMTAAVRDQGSLLNEFAPVTLWGKWSDKPNDFDAGSPLVDLVCPETKTLIVQIGTDSRDGYYPTAMAFFDVAAFQQVLARQHAERLTQTLEATTPRHSGRPRL